MKPGMTARGQRRCFDLGQSSTLLACAFATPAAAQYPDRPIHLIVPQAAGSATDTVARILAAPLAKEIGQQIIVDDRPGGALTVGLDLTAKAPPDGYTLCLGTDRRAGHQPASGGRPALRRRARFSADRAGAARTASAGGVADDAVSVGQGTDRLRQAESGQAFQCVVEQRLARPCRRRIVQVHDRNRHRARAL